MMRALAVVRENAMPGICEELATLLSTVQRPGDFFASGRLGLPAPRLMVDGVGEIALPLLPVQAEQLIGLAERAPYGRGAETIVDTNVRNTWQIGPDRLRLAGKHWQATIDHAVALAAAGLGVVEEPVTAALYKLLIYDKGSFFVGHRDTEKEPGMFATLVLALPSRSSGGALVVRHKEREARLDLANDEPSEMTFAAFYADCVHEVLPITAGCRATLIYNLVRKNLTGKGTGKDNALKPPDYEAETVRAAALLEEWGKSKTAADDGVPQKVVYLLEHAYSLAELGFTSLKGADAAIAAVLKAAAPAAACDLHLALVSIEESGMAEYSGSYRCYDDDDNDEFEAGAVDERDVHLTEWRRVDGEPVDLGELPIEDGEVSPPGALENMEPDEVHFHEATGNAGASFERTYRNAALVLWPRQRRLAVLNQSGPGATVPYLESLAAKWIAQGAQRDSSIWVEAHELSGHMLDTWPEGGWYRVSDGDRDDETGVSAAKHSPWELARLLAVLTTLRDRPRVEAAVALFAARRGHNNGDNATILAAAALFPPKRAAGMIEAIIAGHAKEALGPCCSLLNAAIAGPFVAEPKCLATAAEGLIASLPGDPARAPVDQWGRRHDVTVSAGVIANLMRFAEAVDVRLARRLAAHLIAWPRTYDIDGALIPTVRRLLEGGAQRSSAAMTDLIATCLAHLETRADEPLEAPRNWTRAADIRCKCEHCAALRRFLASPETESWTLKAREDIRAHVEQAIGMAGTDVDVTTLRRSSPYSLICKKNSASYDRRVVQRRRDLADIAALKGTEDAGTSD
jgi:2OG-Fe(II) oxygenase superfamily